MVRLDEAIHYLCPSACFTFIEEDYSTIQWFNNEYEKPTLEEIEIAKQEVEKIKAIEALETEYAIKIAEAKDKLFDAIILDEQTEIAAAKQNYLLIKQELEDKKNAVQ
jgi:hypothetical protein